MTYNNISNKPSLLQKSSIIKIIKHNNNNLNNLEIINKNYNIEKKNIYFNLILILLFIIGILFLAYRYYEKKNKKIIDK
jgi:Leucine-rich repeat (LRR) protein